MLTKRRVTISALTASATFAGLWGYARWTITRLEDRNLAEVPRPGRVIDVDGVGIHYRERGEGDPLILIHGLGASTYNFRYTLLELSDDFRAIAVDLPGFGLSERPASYDYSLINQAHTLTRLMDRLGIEKAHILGHSMGGIVAAHLAARWPDRINKLILVASPVQFSPPQLLGLTVLVPFWQTAVGLLMSNRRMREKIWRIGFYNDSLLTEEVMDNYFTPSRIKGHTRGLIRLATSLRHNSPPDLSEVNCPVLILWGENDHFITSARKGYELQRKLPDARLVLIPEAGHMLLEEKPHETHPIIRDFLLEERSSAASPPEAVMSRGGAKLYKGG